MSKNSSRRHLAPLRPQILSPRFRPARCFAAILTYNIKRHENFPHVPLFLCIYIQRRRAIPSPLKHDNFEIWEIHAGTGLQLSALKLLSNFLGGMQHFDSDGIRIPRLQYLPRSSSGSIARFVQVSFMTHVPNNHVEPACLFLSLVPERTPRKRFA